MKSIEDRLITYFRDNLIRWGRKNFSDFPWRNTKNKWHALVAEIMLQRTKAEQVLPVYQSFCAKYETPFEYLKDPKTSVFQSLGLNWRERELRKLAEALLKTEIPRDKKSLLGLPGVGDYITSAYRSLHLGTRDVIIDSNVVRIYGKFFGFKTDGETRRKKWLMGLSDRITPARRFKDFNYGLIDFTRTVCKPKPLCDACVIRKKCSYYNMHFTEHENKGKKKHRRRN